MFTLEVPFRNDFLCCFLIYINSFVTLFCPYICMYVCPSSGWEYKACNSCDFVDFTVVIAVDEKGP